MSSSREMPRPSAGDRGSQVYDHSDVCRTDNMFIFTLPAKFYPYFSIRDELRMGVKL